MKKPKKWKPKEGGKYYYFNNALKSVSTHYWDGQLWSLVRIKAGNCFKTKKQAQAAIKKIKEVRRNG